MCTPLAIAGVALTVGSTLMQSSAAKDVSKARGAVSSAEADRQEGYDQENQARFSETLTGFDRPKQDVTRLEKQQARNDAVSNAVSDPGDVPSVPTSGSAPRVVKNTVSKSIVDAIEAAKDFGKRKAALDSYGDLSFENSIDLTRSGQDHSMLGSFAAGSSRVLPLELDVANHAGDGKKSIANLMGLAGTAASLAGAAGIGPSFGDLFGPGAPTQLGPATKPVAAGTTVKTTPGPNSGVWGGIY